MGPGALAVGRWSFLDQRRFAPATWVPARLRAGARLSPEKAGGKSAGGCAPWTPDFYYRSFPLAGFCVGYVWTGRRAVTSGIPTPIWNAFSGKNMLKSIFVKDGQRNSPPPLHGAKAFPLGGRCPSAHTGADEGAIDWPNGAEEGRRWGDRPIFLQGKVGYRIAPSSVTFGDSFPQGEAFAGGTPPQRNAFSPNPHSRKMRIQIRAHRWAS